LGKKTFPRIPGEDALQAKVENAWVNWVSVEPNGDRTAVSTLRDHEDSAADIAFAARGAAVNLRAAAI